MYCFYLSRGDTTSFAYRLEFDFTNNVAEYEALFLGLELARDMGIKVLEVVGDSDLVVMQVKDKFLVKNDKLKQ
jgi:ribonuclease HI